MPKLIRNDLSMNLRRQSATRLVSKWPSKTLETNYPMLLRFVSFLLLYKLNSVTLLINRLRILALRHQRPPWHQKHLLVQSSMNQCFSRQTCQNKNLLYLNINWRNIFYLTKTRCFRNFFYFTANFGQELGTPLMVNSVKQVLSIIVLVISWCERRHWANCLNCINSLTSTNIRKTLKTVGKYLSVW